MQRLLNRNTLIYHWFDSVWIEIIAYQFYAQIRVKSDSYIIVIMHINFDLFYRINATSYPNA